MLRPIDIVVLLAMLASTDAWKIRDLAATLEMNPGQVHKSLARLARSRLIDLRSRQVVRRNALEFLVHGLKYSFPLSPGTETRGVPTAWAAMPLINDVTQAGLPPVWPDPLGVVRGVAIEPLHESALRLAHADPALGELLALADAIRLPEARVARQAEVHLRHRLADVAAS